MDNEQTPMVAAGFQGSEKLETLLKETFRAL
jgi:hypothetical protein